MAENRLVTDSLTLEIYVIGYKEQGESIVFFVCVDKQIVYTGVIDCYSCDNRNETIELLKRKNIKEVNFLCWTHPHEDHTVGMIELWDGEQNFITNNTKFILPNGLERNRTYCKDAELILDKRDTNLKEDIRKKNYQVHSVQNYDIIERISFQKSQKKADMIISTIAPNGNILDRKKIHSVEDNNNDYSVAVLMFFGEFSFLFVGDIEDKTIRRFEDFYLPDTGVDFIKIPHHGSETAEKMIELLEKKEKFPEIACSTVKRKKLPQKKILDRYNDRTAKVFCTGNLDSDKDSYNIGIVHCTYNILERSKIAIVECEGNAVDYSASMLS